ncbi:uncharacterized protein F5147DRAFT_658691 [Suillus discolor]|uniref:CCHC-type domain-containing protein n=1 Tax=Suillus discolor TaxID=1912936 RepID=A0A9P7JM98_9AGAM|nr:uncharacterized protein F5147DRAFT_658691 [Suillus discolor]KAG2088471.1 hypothetical protein F5147DRAFT_658691 [Suillus discolor]
MTTPTETPTIVTLKDSDYGRILGTIENCAFSETAILTPAYSREIDNILGDMSATVAASTSLAVHIIKTTKMLEDAALRTDIDEGTRTLAMLHLQKRIRAMALHLLPLDFPDLVNLAVRTASAKPRAKEETRPVRPLPSKKRTATMDRTRTLCKRCGGYGHTFRQCPDYVCCICSEIGPDHLSIHCPGLKGRIVLQEFSDEEKFFEALLDWEQNHKALADLALAFPIPPSPMPATPIPMTPVPATPSTPAPSSQPLDVVLIEAGDFNLSNGVMLQGSVTPTRAPALPTPAPALLDSPRGGAPPAPRKTAVWTAMTPPHGAMTPPDAMTPPLA